MKNDTQLTFYVNYAIILSSEFSKYMKGDPTCLGKLYL